MSSILNKSFLKLVSTFFLRKAKSFG